MFTNSLWVISAMNQSCKKAVGTGMQVPHTMRKVYHMRSHWVNIAINQQSNSKYNSVWTSNKKHKNPTKIRKAIISWLCNQIKTLQTLVPEHITSPHYFVYLHPSLFTAWAASRTRNACDNLNIQNYIKNYIRELFKI